MAVAGRLVGSAPRSEGAIGLLVSAPLDTVPDRASVPTTLCATDFGEVTALGVVPSPDEPLIAVGGDGKVALVPTRRRSRLGRPRWEAPVGFRVAVDRLARWRCCGPLDPTAGGRVDDYDWERLGGGGFAALDPADGRTVMGGPLPETWRGVPGGSPSLRSVAWLVAAGRTGCLHLVDPRTGDSHRSSGPLADTSLGIAHLAVAGGRGPLRVQPGWVPPSRLRSARAVR